MHMKIQRAVFRLQHAESMAVEVTDVEVFEEAGAVRRL